MVLSDSGQQAINTIITSSFSWIKRNVFLGIHTTGESSFYTMKEASNHCAEKRLGLMVYESVRQFFRNERKMVRH